MTQCSDWDHVDTLLTTHHRGTHPSRMASRRLDGSDESTYEGEEVGGKDKAGGRGSE